MSENDARPSPQDPLESALRRAAEAEARAAEAERRLRALDDTKNAILSAVSHELRTPLTSVIGFAHILRQRADHLDAAQRAELLERLIHNALRLESLLGDLLDLDRLKRGILTPVRRPTVVAELLRRIVQEVTPPDRVIEIDADPIVAELDGPKVERIVENLVANATKHTGKGDRVWVWARARPAGVLLAIDNDGAGIPAEDKRTIFRAFSRGTGSTHAPGTGIGLTLVQRFAELHGGMAWVQDREGGGSSFRVFLPARIQPIDETVIDLSDQPAPTH
jgi:hypothetical protein